MHEMNPIAPGCAACRPLVFLPRPLGGCRKRARQLLDCLAALACDESFVIASAAKQSRGSRQGNRIQKVSGIVKRSAVLLHPPASGRGWRVAPGGQASPQNNAPMRTSAALLLPPPLRGGGSKTAQAKRPTLNSAFWLLPLRSGGRWGWGQSVTSKMALPCEPPPLAPTPALPRFAEEGVKPGKPTPNTQPSTPNAKRPSQPAAKSRSRGLRGAVSSSVHQPILDRHLDGT